MNLEFAIFRIRHRMQCICWRTRLAMLWKYLEESWMFGKWIQTSQKFITGQIRKIIQTRFAVSFL